VPCSVAAHTGIAGGSVAGRRGDTIPSLRRGAAEEHTPYFVSYSDCTRYTLWSDVGLVHRQRRQQPAECLEQVLAIAAYAEVSPMTDTVYTIPEVARYLKLSKSKVYYLVQRGELPHIRIGKNVRIREQELRDWLASNSTAPRSQ
jgi:excisionase family DNA binding protein